MDTWRGSEVGRSAPPRVTAFEPLLDDNKKLRRAGEDGGDLALPKNVTVIILEKSLEEWTPALVSRVGVVAA